MSDHDRLMAVADILVDTEPDNSFGYQSHIVRFVDDEIGFLDLEDEHPSTMLLGMTAPPEWWAVGLVTGGWGAPMEATPALAPSSHPDAVRVRMVVLVSRAGNVVSRLRTATGGAFDDPGEGFMLDVLRRTLDLPTPPPTTTTTEFLSALWLSEIAGAADEARRTRGRRLTWSQVARLHPALQLLAREGTRPRPALVLPAARALGNVLTWDRIRQQAQECTWLSSLVPQSLAGWMDEGMLARWLVSELGPVADLADHVARMLRADVAARLNDALAELGVPSTAAA